MKTKKKRISTPVLEKVAIKSHNKQAVDINVYLETEGDRVAYAIHVHITQDRLGCLKRKKEDGKFVK